MGRLYGLAARGRHCRHYRGIADRVRRVPLPRPGTLLDAAAEDDGIRRLAARHATAAEMPGDVPDGANAGAHVGEVSWRLIVAQGDHRIEARNPAGRSATRDRGIRAKPLAWTSAFRRDYSK